MLLALAHAAACVTPLPRWYRTATGKTRDGTRCATDVVRSPFTHAPRCAPGSAHVDAAIVTTGYFRKTWPLEREKNVRLNNSKRNCSNLCARSHLAASRRDAAHAEEASRSGALNTVSRLKGAPDGLPLPPGQLMFLVQGTTNVREFLTDGRGTAEGVLDVLKSSGVAVDSSTSVLDFGCGCGRVIRHVHG